MNVAENQQKWDKRFLDLAVLVSSWSKDPSTKTGAVIARGKRVVSVGFNGFPKGVVDSADRYQDRELKYDLILHCETNSLLLTKADVTGCTLYTVPFGSCVRCIVAVIQAGISRVVFPALPARLVDRWGDSLSRGRMMMEEAGVSIAEYATTDWQPRTLVDPDKWMSIQ